MSLILIPGALKELTDAQLKKAMRAFDIKPEDRTEIGQCFIGFAFGEGTNKCFTDAFLRRSQDNLSHGNLCTLSCAFDDLYTGRREHLYSECIRELAERGIAIESEVTSDSTSR